MDRVVLFVGGEPDGSWPLSKGPICGNKTLDCFFLPLSNCSVQDAYAREQEQLHVQEAREHTRALQDSRRPRGDSRGRWAVRDRNPHGEARFNDHMFHGQRPRGWKRNRDGHNDHMFHGHRPSWRGRSRHVHIGLDNYRDVSHLHVIHSSMPGSSLFYWSQFVYVFVGDADQLINAYAAHL